MKTETEVRAALAKLREVFAAAGRLGLRDDHPDARQLFRAYEALSWVVGDSEYGEQFDELLSGVGEVLARKIARN